MYLCAGGFWSIPAENLSPLLEAIKADFLASSGESWNGYSETLKEYLMKNKIDPKIKYQRFYVNKRHTAAATYTWRGTSLYDIAKKAGDSCNVGKLLFIDVLVVTQFGAELTSDQVMETTDGYYDDCEVWVFLDDTYFDRAWCLAEAAKFSHPASNCSLVVLGSANVKPGTNSFRCMKAGKESDKPLIQQYVLRKYGSEEHFKKAVEDAIVRLSPWSLLYQGRYREALQASEVEILVLKRLPGDNSKYILEAQGTMAVCLQKLGDLERSLTLYEKVLEGQVRCYGTESAIVAATEDRIGIVLMNKGDYENALIRHQKALDIGVKCLGHSHASVADTMQNIGIVHGSMGDQASAKECYRKAHAIYQAAFGADHPTTRGLAPFI